MTKTTDQRNKIPRSRGTHLPGVLHVSRPAAGGLRQHLLTLLHGLADLGVSCSLAAPRDLLDSFVEGCADAGRIRTMELGITDRPRLAADLIAAARLRRIARGYQAVHAHGMRAGWIAALSGVRPYVLTCHNLYSASGNPVARWAGSSALRQAARVIAVSQAVSASLPPGCGPGDRVRVVPNGIVLPRRTGQRSPDAVRADFGAPAGSPLVLCVARLMPDKGVDVLVRAWPLVRAEVPSAWCIVAGDGPDRQSLAEMASGCQGLLLAGLVEDTASLYAAADVVAIPSRREGQSLVCLEAMASSPAPAVVATCAGGLPEMVRDGVTGLLVAPDDPAALAGAVVRLLTDPDQRERLVPAAAAMVTQSYSAGAMCRATLSLYGEACAQARPG